MQKYSMRSMKRRNHQRWFNRYCRYINKSMENDPLWLGRFCVEQNRSDMHWFEDGSGGIMRVELTMRDKKTGITETAWYSGLDMTWRFWYDFNDFICLKCKVWQDRQDEPIDFRKKGK